MVDFVDVSACPCGFVQRRLLIRNFLTAKLFWFWWSTFFWSDVVGSGCVTIEFVEFLSKKEGKK